MTTSKGDSGGDLNRIFPGDGELARRMRDFDWASTELDAPGTWPEHLKTALRICLASPTPIVLWWGPSLTMLYNDACIPLLGAARHRFLGRPARECCAELWPEIFALLERARASGRSTQSDDIELFVARSLPREEIYVRFTCSPLGSPDGESVDGIFMPCTETTEEVVRSRRLELLRELALETANATTVRAVCASAMRALGTNTRDLPFAAIYLVDRRSISSSAASLATTVGLPTHHALPISIDECDVTQLAGVLRTSQSAELEGLDTLVPQIPGRAWPEPAPRAMALPIRMSRDSLAGILVAGLNPRRVPDDAYHAFFERVAGQIGASLVAASACEEERRRAEVLAGIDRVKTAFFSNLSHELRTPLTLMLAPMEEALASAATALQGADLESMHRNAQRLLRRVNTLLDVANLEENRTRAHRPLDLAPPRIDIADSFRAAMERAGIPQPGGGAQIYVDREMWEEIVLDLISNAFEIPREGPRSAPLRARLGTDNGMQPVTAPEPAAEPDLRGHILVVDDNAEMSSYLRRLLSKRWSVECAPDGDAALVAIRARRPSLVLTDVVMPNLDGYGLLRELRADPATAALPVIMLSARAGEDAQSGLEAGADDYIVKPFSARELVARVAARLELHRLGAKLAQERSALAEVFRQTPVPVCIFRGRNLVYESANDAYLQALDLDVRAKSLYDVAPDFARQFGPMLHGVMESGETFVGREVPLQLARYGRIEDTYWTLIFAQLPGAGAEEKYVVAICNEVTEQVVGRKRLEVLAERADAANRMKDDFLAMLGHEMRNPLSPIVTSLQLMRMRGIHSGEQDIIERQISHLRRLVDDMLDVSRIARGKMELRKERIEIAEVVATAIETSTPLLEQRNHRVEVAVPETGLAVDCDPDRMAQVFSNLITNAAKYSEAGARIEIVAERVGDRICVRVVDEGAGIAEDMIDKVFEMFVQQTQTIERSHGGLGLGLSIVRSIVQLHGGVTSVRSDGVGKGAEFSVTLPVAIGRPAAEGAPRRLRLVEDSDDTARVM